MNGRVLISCAAIALLVTAGARAETVVLKSPDKVEIVINHTAGQVEVYGNGQSQPLRRYDLQPDMTFEVSPHVEVVFAVKDPNPLLYAYKLKEAKTEENPDFKSLVDLAKELEKLAGGLGASPMNNLVAPQNASTALKGLTQMSDACAKETDPTKKFFCEQALKKALDSLVSPSDPCADPKLDEDKVRCRLPALLREVRAQADTVPELTAQSFGDSEHVKAAVTGWQLAETRKQLRSLRDSTDRVLTTLALDSADTASKASFLLWKDSERDAADVLDKLDAFAALVKKLGIRQELHEVKELDPALLNHVTVSIEPDAKNFPAGLDKSLRKTGDFHFLLRPYSAVKWSVGPAAVYSFVRDPEFKAVADGDKFKIEKTQDEFRKFAVGAMLTLAPRALDWGNLALTFNVGVTGEKKLGFLLGTSLSAGPLFTLGGGVAFQQAHRLSASQTVGQQLDKAEDLKIDDRFKSGLYIFLAVKVPTGAKSETN